MEITNTIKEHRVIARNTINHKEGNLEVVMNLIYDHLAQFFSDLICKYKREIDIKVYIIHYMNWFIGIEVYLYSVRIDKLTLSLWRKIICGLHIGLHCVLYDM